MLPGSATAVRKVPRTPTRGFQASLLIVRTWGLARPSLITSSRHTYILVLVPLRRMPVHRYLLVDFFFLRLRVQQVAISSALRHLRLQPLPLIIAGSGIPACQHTRTLYHATIPALRATIVRFLSPRRFLALLPFVLVLETNTAFSEAAEGGAVCVCR